MKSPSGRPDVVVIVATRGRPERFAELLGSVAEMSTLDVRVAAGVDDDDPTLPRYLELIDSSPVPLSVHVGRRITMGHAVNRTCDIVVDDLRPRFLASLNDDHRPRTYGWDDLLVCAVRSLDGPGWAYGNDLIQGERLPTAWLQSVEVYDALGWMMYPACAHMYLDDVVREVGRAARRIAYVPEVIIEHLHPIAGKAEWDEGYARENSDLRYREDGAAYERWRSAGGPRLAAALVRELTWGGSGA